jgi:hypothetical protein
MLGELLIRVPMSWGMWMGLARVETLEWKERSPEEYNLKK